MMEKMTVGSVGRDKELILFHEETPCMFWEQTENFTLKSCHSPSNTEVTSTEMDPGIKKKKRHQDKAYTMGLSGTLLMTIICVQQR